MSESSNLMPFLEKLDRDPALQARVSAITTAADPHAELLAIAADHDLPLTDADLLAIQQYAAEELTESELEALAGGNIFDTINEAAARLVKRIPLLPPRR